MQGHALLGARLVLSVLFVVAGVGKLADSEGARQAAKDFGAPDNVAVVLGILLPLVELSIAVALVPSSVAWFGAVGAFVLLVMFSAAIGLALARGKSVDCHCFGRLRPSHAGKSSLLRNVILLLLAGYVVIFGLHHAGDSATNWLGHADSASLALAGAGQR